MSPSQPGVEFNLTTFMEKTWRHPIQNINHTQCYISSVVRYEENEPNDVLITI